MNERIIYKSRCSNHLCRFMCQDDELFDFVRIFILPESKGSKQTLIRFKIRNREIILHTHSTGYSCTQCIKKGMTNNES